MFEMSARIVEYMRFEEVEERIEKEKENSNENIEMARSGMLSAISFCRLSLA